MSQPASRARLPLGVQTFSEIRRENLYYVDKTHFACQLVRQGKHYFLSRPRRFGKSLFVSTLKELFEGNRELFQGLAADDLWDWSVRRPVAHLSFGGGLYTEPGGLHHNLLRQLSSLSRSHGANLDAALGTDRFAQLLEELHRLFGRRVVVLVNEYDKPITENLNQPDLARANRDYLRAVYANIKECDQHISARTTCARATRLRSFGGIEVIWRIPVSLRPTLRTHVTVGVPERGERCVYVAKMRTFRSPQPRPDGVSEGRFRPTMTQPEVNQR